MVVRMSFGWVFTLAANDYAVLFWVTGVVAWIFVIGLAAKKTLPRLIALVCYLLLRVRFGFGRV